MSDLASRFERVEEDNVVRLRPLSASGGRENIDWLSDKDIGFHFIAEQWSTFNKLHEFTLLNKQHGLSLLRKDKRKGKKDISSWQWVDNIVFCKEHTLRSTL